MKINEYLEMISNKNFKVWLEKEEDLTYLVWKKKGKKENFKILNETQNNFEDIKQLALLIKYN